MLTEICLFCSQDARSQVQSVNDSFQNGCVIVGKMENNNCFKACMCWSVPIQDTNLFTLELTLNQQQILLTFYTQDECHYCG